MCVCVQTFAARPPSADQASDFGPHQLAHWPHSSQTFPLSSAGRLGLANPSHRPSKRSLPWCQREAVAARVLKWSNSSLFSEDDRSKKLKLVMVDIRSCFELDLEVAIKRYTHIHAHTRCSAVIYHHIHAGTR